MFTSENCSSNGRSLGPALQVTSETLHPSPDANTCLTGRFPSGDPEYVRAEGASGESPGSPARVSQRDGVAAERGSRGPRERAVGEAAGAEPPGLKTTAIFAKSCSPLPRYNINMA